MTFASESERVSFKNNIYLKIYLIVFLIFWIYTFIFTTNISNWFTENALTILFLTFIIFSYKKFKFSDFSYTLMFVFILLHTYGAQYTYAENPFGYWLKDNLHLARNHYDRIVHFSFGLLLAYPMRDYFKNWFDWPSWVCWLLPIEITLSFSCLYELIEWAVAQYIFPSEGMAYLGTQGDIWDAQKDMCIAFFGAVTIIIIMKFIYSKFSKIV
ncbi:MAG: DUF2238 domain-containing protein [Chlorobiota bacterium]|jgi:putative membrane protein|nr:DUF2238 domain-containing protein [Chlorobiota bacterium]QQS67302.1 MAG: DUF2238 domain-containing protein [Chlorobiota bacterium]